MSDLYQLLKKAKGGHAQLDLIEDRIAFWQNQAKSQGPICCFFTRQKGNVGAEDQQGYVDV